MIGGLVASATLDFAGRGVALVGDVPRGFAAPTLPSVSFIVRALLQRDGVIDELGQDKIYGNVYEAAADRIPGAAQT